MSIDSTFLPLLSRVKAETLVTPITVESCTSFQLSEKNKTPPNSSCSKEQSEPSTVNFDLLEASASSEHTEHTFSSPKSLTALQIMQAIAHSCLNLDGSPLNAPTKLPSDFQLSDFDIGGHSDNDQTPASFTPSLVFGIPLDKAVENSCIDPSVPVPALVVRCIQYLDNYGQSFIKEIQFILLFSLLIPFSLFIFYFKLSIIGLNEIGLYRIPGATKTVSRLRAIFDIGRDFDLVEDAPDPNAVATLLKTFLRELPETVLTPIVLTRVNHFMLSLTGVGALFSKGIGGAKAGPQIPGHINPKIRNIAEQLAQIVCDIPDTNYHLLYWITRHLARIDQNNQINLMTMSNLSMIFCPTLGIGTTVFTIFVLYNQIIFPIPRIKRTSMLSYSSRPLSYASAGDSFTSSAASLAAFVKHVSIGSGKSKSNSRSSLDSINKSFLFGSTLNNDLAVENGATKHSSKTFHNLALLSEMLQNYSKVNNQSAYSSICSNMTTKSRNSMLSYHSLSNNQLNSSFQSSKHHSVTSINHQDDESCDAKDTDSPDAPQLQSISSTTMVDACLDGVRNPSKSKQSSTIRKETTRKATKFDELPIGHKRSYSPALVQLDLFDGYQHTPVVLNMRPRRNGNRLRAHHNQLEHE